MIASLCNTIEEQNIGSYSSASAFCINKVTQFRNSGVGVSSEPSIMKLALAELSYVVTTIMAIFEFTIAKPLSWSLAVMGLSGVNFVHNWADSAGFSVTRSINYIFTNIFKNKLYSNESAAYVSIYQFPFPISGVIAQIGQQMPQLLDLVIAQIDQLINSNASRYASNASRYASNRGTDRSNGAESCSRQQYTISIA